MRLMIVGNNNKFYNFRTYLKLDKRVRFLICAVKLWMNMNKLAGMSKFISYGQVWTVLFFLMQADIAVVPTVTELRNNMMSVDKQKLFCEGELWQKLVPSVAAL